MNESFRPVLILAPWGRIIGPIGTEVVQSYVSGLELSVCPGFIHTEAFERSHSRVTVESRQFSARMNPSLLFTVYISGICCSVRTCVRSLDRNSDEVDVER